MPLKISSLYFVLLSFSETIDFAQLDFNATEDAYLGKNLVVCGFGNIDNKKTKAKTLQCTELLGVAKADCTGAPDKTICTSSPKDNNVCGGKFLLNTKISS